MPTDPFENALKQHKRLSVVVYGVGALAAVVATVAALSLWLWLTSGALIGPE
jgi:hypothetical protein